MQLNQFIDRAAFVHLSYTEVCSLFFFSPDRNWMQAMTENRRKISFSDTASILSYSTDDPVRLQDASASPLHHRLLVDPRVKKLSVVGRTPTERRHSDVARPDLARLQAPDRRHSDLSSGSPRRTRNEARSRLVDGERSIKKGMSMETLTVDRYITSIVRMCSNDALASTLDPPPKGSDEYEQVLEELKDK